MQKYLLAFGLLTAVVTGGCAATGYSNDGYYYTGVSYNPSCDYYTPPWGYPADYCRYRIWNEPVYSGGVWFNGPIYYRTIAGANSFWLNGNWHRDEWRGARPNIDYSRGRNQFWRGNPNHGRTAGDRAQRDRRAGP